MISPRKNACYRSLVSRESLRDSLWQVGYTWSDPRPASCCMLAQSPDNEPFQWKNDDWLPWACSEYAKRLANEVLLPTLLECDFEVVPRRYDMLQSRFPHGNFVWADQQMSSLSDVRIQPKATISPKQLSLRLCRVMCGIPKRFARSA